MFDRGTLMDLVYMTSNTAPYLYRIIGPYGNTLSIDYGDGAEYYYGGNPILDDDTYIPGRNAFNSVDASRLTEQSFTLIRGAGAARIQVTNAASGEVYFQRELGELYPAYYDPSFGDWGNPVQYAKLNWSGTDAAGKPLAEGTLVNVSMTAVPHYYRRADGSYSYEGLGEGSTMTTTMTIDNTAPKALSIDTSRVDQDRLRVTAQDNEYVAAVALLNAAGSKIYTAESPNQTERNKKVTVELDLSEIYGSNFLVAVYDYAFNQTVYEVKLELGSPDREYFTAYDSNSNSYVSVNRQGQVTPLYETGLPVTIRAMEYVGGYVFSITDDNSFCVADDADLSSTRRICKLDAANEWRISGFNDMAYNKADGKLYALFYSMLNDMEKPYLCTIDMLDGTVHVIGVLPEDVNTLAIDGKGNFYSAGYGDTMLYTYTLKQITASAPTMTEVGNMGYYYTEALTSMAWDHNEDALYWAFPNTLLKINSKTGEPTLLGYQTQMLVGLYTRPSYDEGMFDPVKRVDRVELGSSETRILKGKSLSLEASVWPWNTTDPSVTWSSSDPSVASVDAAGNVSAKALGECTITATSKLDPTKRASCTVTVFSLDQTLQALIWDDKGEVWMSEFNSDTLPTFEKLSANALGANLASATMGQDGSIYAASLNTESLHSDLYKLDPVTFQPTRIGASTDAYMDLAPAPGQPGNSLMAVFSGYVLHVDATSGDYYNTYYMFQNNLVGIAYVGTQEYQEYGYDTMIDWYFIIDQAGYVYLLGFLEQDGRYFYLEHDLLAPNGIYTKLDVEMDTPYYGSAYFDGEMLYYSAYRQSQDNVNLLAIDVAGGTKACYDLGTFDEGIWPVAGLMELGKSENHIGVILGEGSSELLSSPTPVEQTAERKGLREEMAEGTLNNATAPLSSGGIKDELLYVDITLPEAGTNAGMTVEFDSTKLALVDVSGNTAAFAWKAGKDQVNLSLAEADVISGTKTVARLCFRAQKGVLGGETDLTIRTRELGQSTVNRTEKLTVQIPLPHNPFTDVEEGRFYYLPVLWAVENGITYGLTETIFGTEEPCTRSQVVTFLYRAAGSPATKSTTHSFVDVKKGSFYEKAVIWAVENGITVGTDATHFDPDAPCTRSAVVTFLWRAKGKPAATGTIPFTDVSPNKWYAQPVLWAVQNGITYGMTETLFDTEGTCTRGQVVTFLYRAFAK
jgi:hypothetical protein